MDDEELMDAFEKIVEESISNTAIRNKILREVKSRLEVRGIFPAKGILAEINKHSDLEVSQESGLLIKKYSITSGNSVKRATHNNAFQLTSYCHEFWFPKYRASTRQLNLAL